MSPRPPPEGAWTSVDLVLADGTTIEVGRVPVASRVDLGTVEGLARMQVGARRRGWRLALHHPQGRACSLAQLLDLVGLSAPVEEVVAEARALLGAAAEPPASRAGRVRSRRRGGPAARTRRRGPRR